MLRKQKLFVFPTSRSIRSFINEQKSTNTLLPFTLTIDEFLKKSIIIPNKKYCDEEERFLFLKESIKNVNIKKLGISDSFTKFLKQNEYIYRFFLELSSEKLSIEDIQTADTYDYYNEHLEILKTIYKNYIELLDKNNCVDRVNLNSHYKINEIFLDKFDSIELIFEGYFTKVEFDIINKVSKYKNLEIKFNSNEYNKKSLEVFSDINENSFDDETSYIINLTNKSIINKTKNIVDNKNIEIKAFSNRINQIAFIKSKITECIHKGINPSNIALVLPDESFAHNIELFDNERYFNFAMGRSIQNYKLYEVSYAIYNYINENETKFIQTLEYLKIDKKYIDNEVKNIWNNNCTSELFETLINYIKNFETNDELLEKYDDLLYKLNRLLFTSNNALLVKDVYKIYLQKLNDLKLDDINSGKITVLGLLETRASSFDAIIICDFNESFIPKTSVKDKFLSTNIKNRVNLPTSIDRESLQKYYYKRLIDSSKNIFISYVNSDSNQITRFVNELFDFKIDEKLYDNSYRHILYNNHNIKHFDEQIIENIDLVSFEWSATSLRNFLECKRRFYLQYILKLKEHTISLKPKGFELGDIIHKILEEYYKVSNDSSELSYDKIESLFNKYRSENPFLVLDLEIWKKKLEDFYNYDMKRLQNTRILDLEKNFNIRFDEFKLKGVIDRIDLKDEVYEVIDYKTSSALKVDSLKNYEKSKDFQLEFYYLAVSELYNTDKVNSYYYDLHNTKLVEEVALDKKLELLVEKFSEIKELDKDKIDFKKCEEKSTCQFCIYKTICNRE